MMHIHAHPHTALFETGSDPAGRLEDRNSLLIGLPDRYDHDLVGADDALAQLVLPLSVVLATLGSRWSSRGMASAI